MSNWEYAGDVPTSPWRSAMSLPRELSFRNTPEGLRMVQEPVSELEKLRTKRVRWDSKREVLVLDRTRSGRVDFNSRFSRVSEAPLKARDGKIRLHLFIDTSSLEIFASDGRSVISSLLLPGESTDPIQFQSTGASTRVRRLTAWKLKAAVPISPVKEQP